MRIGMQKMLRDAEAQSFDVVLSEAMDRVSRNQADIASVFQRFQFRGVMIETLSEGLLSEMQIGMKGTMNAIFIKDLGDKTRRGLMGRALAGKCAGGKAYGYKNLVKFTEAGDPIKGDRAIIPHEAATVVRIFTDYANGVSPMKIASALNAEGINGPTGKGWGASTVHGNRERGTGILNNQLYERCASLESTDLHEEPRHRQTGLTFEPRRRLGHHASSRSADRRPSPLGCSACTTRGDEEQGD